MNEKYNEYSFDEIKIGLKKTFQVTITESMENDFVKLSGNYNPLASNEEYAATTTFKKRICPGMFTAIFFSRLVGMYLPGKHALLFSQSLNFPNVCYIGDTITVEGEVIDKSVAFKMITLNTVITNQIGKKLVYGKARVIVRDD